MLPGRGVGHRLPVTFHRPPVTVEPPSLWTTLPAGLGVPYDPRMAFTRIKIDHQIMGGLPCIAGTRIPVAMLVRMVAADTPIETILAEYPQLVEEDIREALRFAAANVDQRVVPLDQSA